LRGLGLGFSRFARRYYGNHSLFSFPEGTEMFHFPSFAPPVLFIQTGVTQLFAALGFPIRTSPAQRSVGNSPELFAATHVLHRLLAPRHPPHALSSLLTRISRPPTPASQQACEDSKPGSRPQLFAAGPKDYAWCLMRFPSKLRRRGIASGTCISLCENSFSAEIELPFV
jgi:hypothetical protein